MIEKRRSDRLFNPVPVFVSGKDQQGSPFEEKTFTVTIGRHGASIILNHIVKPDEGLILKNLRNSLEGRFRLVKSVQGVFAEGKEWGMGSPSLRPDFWGIEFPDASERLHPQVLLQCGGCPSQRLIRVSRQEYEALLEAGHLPGYCGCCGETAQWHPTPRAFPSELPGGDVLPRRSASRRQYVRLSLTMLIKVRNRRNGVRTVQTFDVCKSGLAFTTRTEYLVGERLYLTLPYSEAWKEPVEIKGRTIRATRGTTAYVYGVQYDT